MPRDKSSQFVALSTSLLAIACMFVAQRFIYKIYSKMSFYVDDWMTLFATMCVLSATFINVYGLAANGLGQDVWMLSPEQITTFGFYFYVDTLFYFWNIAMLKVVLVLFYMRIFQEPLIQRLLRCTMVVLVLFIVIFQLVVIFQCEPIAYYWKRWDGNHKGKCLDVDAIGWTNAMIGILLDLWMLAIPLSQLRHLQLSWRKKLGIGTMFFIGTL